MSLQDETGKREIDTKEEGLLKYLVLPALVSFS